MRKVTDKEGLKGNSTTHSVKASLATQLFERAPDERLNQEGIGHRSVQAISKYKLTTKTSQPAVSSISQESMRKQTKRHNEEKENQYDLSLKIVSQAGTYNNCVLNFQMR